MEDQTTKWHEGVLRTRREVRESNQRNLEAARVVDAAAARDAINAGGLSKSKVARLLGVSRPTLYAILER